MSTLGEHLQIDTVIGLNSLILLSLPQDFLLQNLRKRRTGTEVQKKSLCERAQLPVCVYRAMFVHFSGKCRSSLLQQRGLKLYSSTYSSRHCETDVWFKMKRLIDASSHSSSSHFETGRKSSHAEVFIWTASKPDCSDSPHPLRLQKWNTRSKINLTIVTVNISWISKLHHVLYVNSFVFMWQIIKIKWARIHFEMRFFTLSITCNLNNKRVCCE